jgi:hypothetical protein
MVQDMAADNKVQVHMDTRTYQHPLSPYRYLHYYHMHIPKKRQGKRGEKREILEGANIF